MLRAVSWLWEKNVQRAATIFKGSSSVKKIILCTFLGLSLSSPAYAMTHFLTAQWYENGNQMCKYDNGTVLNVGAHICPLSIQG